VDRNSKDARFSFVAGSDCKKAPSIMVVEVGVIVVIVVIVVVVLVDLVVWKMRTLA
jgi:hypothetical protein